MKHFAVIFLCLSIIACGQSTSVGDKLEFDNMAVPEKCLVVYSETGSCIDCWTKQFPHWQARINRMHKSNPEVTVIFILAPSREDDMEAIRHISIDHASIIVDSTRAFRKSNHLRREIKNSCFVINQERTILYIGDPLYSNGQWNEIMSL